MTTRIGIMQGRLLPPQYNKIQCFPSKNWRAEFPIATSIGFDNIEFIFDMTKGDIEDHPLLEPGCSNIIETMKQSNVAVNTICADYFMDHPFHQSDKTDVEKSLALLKSLIVNTRQLHVSDIIIPCVDNSTLSTGYDYSSLRECLLEVLPLCEEHNVNLSLETDLNPTDFLRLLNMFTSPRVRVNYDVGNSASLGYDPVDEWDAYGELISSVHIKDRVMGGTTVPLGKGDVHFDKFFKLIAKTGYRGLLVLQAARGDDHIETAARYLQFTKLYLEKYIP